jgi:hypothetical protein
VLLAVLLSASLGSTELTVDPLTSTAGHEQEAFSLTLLAPLFSSATVSGEFSQSRDWSSVDRIFVEAAIDGENPQAFFSLELYGWDGLGLELINTYAGITTGLSSSFGLLELELLTPGSGDFSNFRALQFVCNSLLEDGGGLTIRSVVGSAGPIVPVITSAAHSADKFTMTWSGTGVLPVNVERRNSLEAGGWTTVAQGNATGHYTDDSPPSGKAFYRVVVP